MAAEYIRLQGDRELRRRLQKLAGPQLRKVATRSVREALRPMLRQAKRLTPVTSGRPKASLGMQVTVHRASGSVQGRIGPRRNFRYTARGGIKRVTGSGRQKRKALAKGYVADRVAATMYARGIEFGRDRSGRVRRRRGPAHFLTRALDAQSRPALDTLGAAFRRHTTST
jgi:hypothetical protein